MNLQEEQQFGAIINTNRLVAIVVIIATLAISLAMWVLRDSYQDTQTKADAAVQKLGHQEQRIARLEEDFQQLSSRIDRRLDSLEVGITEVRIWIAEQRGRGQ